MYQSLDLFQTSALMARHAGARQAVVATNVANADTPGYRAQAIPSFRDAYRASETGSLRATRPMHLGGDFSASSVRMGDRAVEPSPNGNAVSIEMEMLAGVEAGREHNRALNIYRHAMTVIRNVVSGR